jgi:hypothetical protein
VVQRSVDRVSKIVNFSNPIKPKPEAHCKKNATALNLI